MNVPARSLCRDTKMQKSEILKSAVGAQSTRPEVAVATRMRSRHSYRRDVAIATNMYDMRKAGALLFRASHHHYGVAA